MTNEEELTLWHIRTAQQDYQNAIERSLPSRQFAGCLKIMIDGNQWCVLFGENLQDGVSGFGDTPELAIMAFDRAWHATLVQEVHQP